MLLSVERPFAGASAFVIPGATPRHRHGLVTAVPPASTEHVRTDNRGAPGTCEILPSPPRAPGRRHRVTNSRPRRCTRPPGSEEDEWARRYRQTKATKCGGTGGRKS